MSWSGWVRWCWVPCFPEGCQWFKWDEVLVQIFAFLTSFSFSAGTHKPCTSSSCSSLQMGAYLATILTLIKTNPSFDHSSPPPSLTSISAEASSTPQLRSPSISCSILFVRLHKGWDTKLGKEGRGIVGGLGVEVGKLVLEIVLHALNLFCLEEGGNGCEDWFLFFQVEFNFILMVVLEKFHFLVQSHDRISKMANLLFQHSLIYLPPFLPLLQPPDFLLSSTLQYIRTFPTLYFSTPTFFSDIHAFLAHKRTPHYQVSSSHAADLMFFRMVWTEA